MRLSFSNLVMASALIHLTFAKAGAGALCLRDRDCNPDLKCHFSKCTDYSQLMVKKTIGKCRSGTSEKNSNKFKMMSYNVFLLSCPIFSGIFPCQSDQVHDMRIPNLSKWFASRDEDVVVIQEIFNKEDKFQAGIGSAGYCHQVTLPMSFGSGLGIFSKHPIVEVDFMDFSDLVTFDEGFFDKGVMYAKIFKHNRYYHVFNTHTRSNSFGNEASTRQDEFRVIKKFVKEKRIPSHEMILLGGDFNEDKWHEGDASTDESGHDYDTMIKILEAEEIKQEGPIKHSQNTERNNLLEMLWVGDEKYEEYAELLDFVFADKRGLLPDNTSFCEVVIPQWPRKCNSAKCMLSDHFPNTCTIYINGFYDNAKPEDPPSNIDDGKLKMWDGGDCMLDQDCNSDHCDYSLTCRAKMKNGSRCAESTACASGYCSFAFKCSDKRNGASCAIDSDCLSDHCENYSFKCAPKMSNGSTCAESTACASGHCNSKFECSDKRNGSSCGIDSDCYSKRCTWNFKCEEKMNSGSPCGDATHNDGDCKSGECSYIFWKGFYCE